MSKFKDFVIEAQEQLWDEYMEEHPEATTADLERDIPYDMIYERAQANLDAIADYKADLIMGK